MWKVIASLAAILVAAMAILTTSQTQYLDLAAKALPFVVDKTNRKVIERLSRAIQFKTISNESGEQDFSDEFERLHKFLATEFPLTYQHLQVQKINKLSLLFKWQGARTDLQPALLLAHQDVVPTAAETTNHWTHPPFSGENDGDYIWGRGTLDDKASLMAILEATEHLLAQGFQPQRTFYLGFGHDEELGGTRGAARIADYFRQHQIRVAYTLDEGGLILAQGVVNKAKTRWH